MGPRLDRSPMRSSSQCPRGIGCGRHLLGAVVWLERYDHTHEPDDLRAATLRLHDFHFLDARGERRRQAGRPQTRPRQAMRSRAEGFSSEDGLPSATPATTSPRQCFARRTSSAGVSSSSGADLGRRGWSGSRRRTTPASARHAIFGMRTHGSCGGDCTACGRALARRGVAVAGARAPGSRHASMPAQPHVAL